jgi:hypothetical protein
MNRMRSLQIKLWPNAIRTTTPGYSLFAISVCDKWSWLSLRNRTGKSACPTNS